MFLPIYSQFRTKCNTITKLSDILRTYTLVGCLTQFECYLRFLSPLNYKNKKKLKSNYPKITNQD